MSANGVINRDNYTRCSAAFSQSTIKFSGITHELGNARKLARQAADDDCQMAAVYGGDGSVVNAAVGLLEKDIPLMIFPGGTGNVIAKELGARSASDNQPAVPEQPGRLQIRYHWQARAINIKTDPPQKVSLDGEMIGETPSKITLLPQAVEIIVPATA